MFPQETLAALRYIEKGYPPNEDLFRSRRIAAALLRRLRRLHQPSWPRTISVRLIELIQYARDMELELYRENDGIFLDIGAAQASRVRCHGNAFRCNTC